MMVEPPKEPTGQVSPSASAASPAAPPSGVADPDASTGERVLRKRRREKKTRTRVPSPRQFGPILWRWMAGVLGAAAITFVLVMRFWWVVFVILAVVLLLGATYKARSKKKRRPVPWMKLAVIGGVSASIAIIGPVIALRAGGNTGERESSGGGLDAPLDLPGSFEATISGLQLLVVDFVVATIGIVLLASALSHHLRSRRANDD